MYGGREWQSSGAGLPPQECGLSQISVPPPSPPLLPFKATNCRGHKEVRPAADRLQEEADTSLTDYLKDSIRCNNNKNKNTKKNTGSD